MRGFTTDFRRNKRENLPGDTRELTGTTLFGQIAAHCQVARGVALLLIRDSAVNAPSLSVFVISTANGNFLRKTVGFDRDDRSFQLPGSH